MMNTYKNYALICASLFILSGCLEEKFEPQGIPAEIGDEVIFGARAGFENPNPDTKTVYNGETYKENGKVFHSIDWVYGKDKIEIYSPQGIGINPSCYTVNKSVIENGNENDYAYLTRNNSNGAIQWSSAEVHDFYAMYPSSDTFINQSDGTLRDGVKMTNAIVNGVIPDKQKPLKVSDRNENNESTGDWVATPNMEYAYMVAHGQATRKDGAVNLSFIPIVTAVEIELTLTVPKDTPPNNNKTYLNTLTVTHAKIETAQNSDIQLTGSFTCDLEAWVKNGKKDYPTCVGVKENYNNEIEVELYDEDGAAITIKDGGSLKFTVFVLPHTDIDKLKVSFSSDAGTNYLGKELEFTNIKIKKNCKNIISNLSLPPMYKEKEPLSAGNWITNLSDDVNLNRLSIPGTGGSFTFASNVDGARQQHDFMNIDAQWNLGIRAFEIVSNRPQNGNGIESLGTQPIRCAQQNMGSHTVYSAIKDLIIRVTQTDSDGNLLNKEFAVVILTYQPEGGNSNPRNAAQYALSLNKLFTTKDTGKDGLADYVGNTIIPFNPNITIHEARNKVMIICRINQEGESEPEGPTGNESGTPEQALLNYQAACSTLAEDPVLVINGCGTAKDKWRRRGYSITYNNNSQPAANLANYGEEFDPEVHVEYYIRKKQNNAWDFSGVIQDPDLVDFMYPTNHGLCWFQEWARVSPGDENGDYLSGFTYKRGGFFGIGGTTYYPAWPETYNEKYKHATSTFDKAINNELNGITVINSLCGFFVSKQYNNSYVPYGDDDYEGGTNGDIQGLASKLNTDFYRYVNAPDTDIENKTGPTGIILMDFVTNKTDVLGTADEGSHLLPNVILQNNSKFSIKNTSDANVANGGNAIMY